MRDTMHMQELHVTYRKTSELIPYANNARKHSDEQVTKIASSIKEFGFTNPILLDGKNGIIAGHGRLMAAKKLGIENVPTIDLHDMSEAQKKAYIIADNKLALDADWDFELLNVEFEALRELDFDVGLTGFDSDEICESRSKNKNTEDDDIPDEPEEPRIKRGEIWKLGQHVIACGDACDRSLREQLFNIVCPQMLLTDPPYCSGGFQETGRAAGSIGTRTNAAIENDKLSTRGYIAMMSNILSDLDVGIAYVFTDWRMWSWLFDSLEGNGFNVKSMIVWAKENAGLGLGWRPQHELIACAKKGDAVKFELKNGNGNVLRFNRTGNVNHPTEKPVSLMNAIIGVTPDIECIYDPFLGSGTTLITAERMGKRVVGTELSPGFCDVVVQRWENETGKKAEIVSGAA